MWDVTRYCALRSSAVSTAPTIDTSSVKMRPEASFLNKHTWTMEFCEVRTFVAKASARATTRAGKRQASTRSPKAKASRFLSSIHSTEYEYVP